MKPLIIGGNGAITLSSGILADDPVVITTSAVMVKEGIHSFVQVTALEGPTGKWITVVSFGMLESTYEKPKRYFQGHNHIPISKVVNTYVRSIEGKTKSQIIRYYE